MLPRRTPAATRAARAAARATRAAARAGCLAAAAAALLASVLLAEPTSAAAADAGTEEITAYLVSLDLRTDGSMRVEETITYDFGGTPRHGIEREIRTRTRYDDQHDRSFPVGDVEVSSETAPDQVTESSSGDETVLRIGDPARTVTGTHTYRIGYTVTAATTRFADHDEIYWNAIGPGWTVPVSRADVQVSGPGNVGSVQCFAGPAGSRDPCPSATRIANRAVFSSPRLAPGDALTVVAAYPVGSVATAAPILVDRLTGTRFLVGNPAVAVPAAAALVGLPLLALVRARRRKRALEEPALPARSAYQPEPPAGVRPVLVTMLLTGSVKPGDQVAMLLDLSARGYLSITPAGRNSWRLVAARPPDAELRPEEYELLAAVFRGGPDTTLAAAGRALQVTRSRTRAAVRAEVVANGWYTTASGGRAGFVALGVLMIFLTLPAVFLLGFLAHAGLAGLALGLGGILTIVHAVRKPAPRTPEGELVRSRLLAFRAYLAGVDPGRYPPEQREAALAGLLPYAVVLGLAPQLAAAFLAAGVVAGGYGSDPYWWSTFSDDATRASTPIASSSSGGSSSGFSGGSSGGGGGGGGGGSW